MLQNAYDVTIIGGGPVGMYAAFYAGLRNLKVKIIDALPELGGKLKAMYPEKYIYDIPGFEKIKANDLVKQLAKQMNNLSEKITLVLNERVDYVRRRDDDQILEICTEQACHYTKTVLITAGKGAFQPRTLGLANEKKFLNIHYYVKDIEQFRDKRVAIFGGGDSAVDWANMLTDVAKKVTIVHRRNTFRAHEQSIKQMMSSTVNVLTPFYAQDLSGKDGFVSEIIVQNSETKISKALEIDEVIVLYGFLSALGPIENWDLTLEEHSLLVDSNQQTNILGVYAAGDSCIYPGKVKMITCGFGEAVVSINSIYRYLNPTLRNIPVYSSALKKN